MKILTLFVCFTLAYANPVDYEVDSESREIPSLEIEPEDSEVTVAGTTPSFICKIHGAQGQVWWTKDETNLTFTNNTLVIEKASRNDTGIYTCLAKTSQGILLNKTLHVRVIEPGVITAEEREVRVKPGEPANLMCHVQGEQLSNFEWTSDWFTGGKDLTNFSTVLRHDETHLTMTLHHPSFKSGDTGMYTCRANYPGGRLSAQTYVQVISEPSDVVIMLIEPVGASAVFLTWNLIRGDNSVLRNSFQYITNGTQQWQDHTGPINCTMVAIFPSCVLKGLENGTTYKFRLVVSNSVGDSPAAYSDWVTTLEKDSDNISNFSITATTLDSITIKFSPPPIAYRQRLYVFRIIATSPEDKTRQFITNTWPGENYVMEDLKPGTSYRIKAAVCSRFDGRCSDWSPEQEAITMNTSA